MKRVNPRRPWGLLVMLTGLSATPAAHSDALSVVQMLRAGGCGGIVPAAPPLRYNPSLDRAAEQWADGHSLESGSARGLRLMGSDEALIQRLRRTRCDAVSSRELREVGIYHRGSETYLVLTAPPSSPAPVAYAASTTTGRTGVGAARPAVSPAAAASPAPVSSATPAMASRALQLVNEARARGARCGAQSFAPAPPLSLSGTLAGVALGHATDMAVHDYFEHEDPSGQSPADRVRAAGYHEKLVGENIAYGPETVDEAVKGWLASPGHCQNIMDPRFAEMGLGLAPGRASRRGLFWVQLLAEPRA
ncbi:MAG TPA: CAP domain-containing protein [Steroidobacteraceae bacterium]|nr:CAP domain-containing protein [Steroidobacteraceae bacterium]